jgi:hypothetical protein
MKRHTRPYGCTFPKCNKNFGSKNDWKRHENSQHFQLETWRCQLLRPDQACCAELFYRREMFEEHLKDKHRMINNDRVMQEIKKRRIGRNGQGQFWYGFCKDIVPLESKRSAARDERLNHIDVHFSKELKKIEEWLCLEAKMTKGEVLKEMDKNNSDEDDEVDVEDGNDDTNPTDSQDSSTQMAALFLSRLTQLLRRKSAIPEERLREYGRVFGANWVHLKFPFGVSELPLGQYCSYYLSCCCI